MDESEPRHGGGRRRSMLEHPVRLGPRLRARRARRSKRSCAPPSPRLLVLGACCVAVAPAASARPVTPKSAPAFRDSVGVVTHIVYYDTAYGNWPQVVARLDELGVRHLRDGVYANPRPSGATGTSATTGRSSSPPPTACASPSGWAARAAGPARSTSSWTSSAAGCATPPRRSRRPTSSTSTSAAGAGRSRLSPTAASCYRKVKATPSLRSLPVLGPSFATLDGPSRVGDQRAWLDVGNIHPYTGGLSPDPRAPARPSSRARGVSAADKPVWATEAGFHNAMRAPTGEQPPRLGARPAPCTCCAPSSSTSDDGIRAHVRLRAARREARARAAATPSSTSACCATTSAASRPSTPCGTCSTVVGRDDRRPALRPLRIERLRAGRRRAPARAAEGRRHLPRRALAPGQRLGPRPPPPAARGARAP